MKIVLVVGVVGVLALYWQGSKVAPPGSDIGTVLQAGLASISWPTPHGTAGKPCGGGCGGAATGGAATGVHVAQGGPTPIELVAS